MNSGLPRPLRFLATAGTLTALAYTLGVAYSLGFYGRVGLDNLNLLGFGLQDHVLSSYAAVTVMLDRSAPLTLVIAAVAIGAAVLIGYRGRLPSFLALVLIAFVTIGIAAIVWLVQPVGGGLLLFGATSLVTAIGVAEIVRQRRSPGSEQLHAAHSARHRSVREALAYILVFAGIVVGWRALVGGAAQAGRIQACEVAVGSDEVTPLVELVTSERVIEDSGAIRVVEMANDPDQFRLFNARLFNTAPSGVIIYPDDRAPRELIFIPHEQIVSIQFTPDGGNVGGVSPDWC